MWNEDMQLRLNCRFLHKIKSRSRLLSIGIFLYLGGLMMQSLIFFWLKNEFNDLNLINVLQEKLAG